MVCLSHFSLIHVSFQAGYTRCVCVYGELALQNLCPFKAGYTRCVCMVTSLTLYTTLTDRVTEKSLQTTRKSEKKPFFISQLCKEYLLILSCV